MKISGATVLNLFLVFVPVPIIGEYLHWSANVIFFTSCLAIIPLAGLMGKATEHLADRVGEGIGGLLNATFGNACELIIALAALRAGLIDVVKASITGSIIGNILLVLGASMLAGGLKYQKQSFNRTAATTSATLLALAAISLTVPSVFHFSVLAPHTHSITHVHGGVPETGEKFANPLIETPGEHVHPTGEADEHKNEGTQTGTSNSGTGGDHGSGTSMQSIEKQNPPTESHHSSLTNNPLHQPHTEAECKTIQQSAHVSETKLALAISIVQMIVYFLSLLFSLKTHKQLYVRESDDESAEAIGVSGWGVKTSVSILLVCTVLVAILSEYMVHAVEATAHTMHMTQLFIGVILVAIIGNAAEHSTAILMAMKDKMDLALNIALGSGAQIALFVAPVIVFASFIMGKPMDLCFSHFEILAIVVSVIILQYVATDGECNWLEGVQLLAVYTILGFAFFFA